MRNQTSLHSCLKASCPKLQFRSHVFSQYKAPLEHAPLRPPAAESSSTGSAEPARLRKPESRHKPTEAVESSRLDVTVKVAREVAELRAAAHLRAAALYSYPAGRSEFSTRAHRSMKMNDEVEVLQRKIAGTAHDWQGVAVTCLIAVINATPAVEHLSAVLDPACQLQPVEGAAVPQLVVGTLDINQGSRLPSEELQGSLPARGAAAQRAYLSNVCVAAAAQRQSVATALIAAAKQLAAEAGVLQLYVHVRTRNTGALALYTRRCGFEAERRETESAARALGLPPRALLRCTLIHRP